MQVKERPTVESNIKKLLIKRYDLIIANSEVALYMAMLLSTSEKLQEQYPPVDTGNMHLGISKASPLTSSIQ